MESLPRQRCDGAMHAVAKSAKRCGLFVSIRFRRKPWRLPRRGERLAARSRRAPGVSVVPAAFRDGPEPTIGRYETYGFTLIEVLAVIAILGVLAAIGSRVLHAAKERSRLAQCRAELACFAQALADYKQSRGDFPLAAPGTDAARGALFSAVAENSRVDRARLSTTSVDNGRVAFIDPWGNPYIYCYRSGPGNEWAPGEFVLFSAGPDGLSLGPDSTGQFAGGRRAAGVNADNIHADDPP